jgi:hypothetical protein
MRRYALLELPAWLLVAVSVAYAIASGGAGFFFQAALIVAAIAWLAGGRIPDFAWGSLLLGWAVGTMVLFNLLVAEFQAVAIALALLPVSVYVAVVLVLLQLAGTARSRFTAVGGVILSTAALLVALGLFQRT